jgi:hypothetical protein
MTLTVQECIDELDAFFGVREPVPAKPLIRLHRAGQLERLIAAIAEHMRLPVQFKLSVVSKDTRFRSHSLARTDGSGRGIEGIEAQVAIPSSLPLFGSAELRRYPIDVLITPAFRTARPETAITILAHELSHVLLHSLRHPERDSEVFTDLVPIVLGFAEIINGGSKVSSVTHVAGGTRETTTTYGYLSDVDFSFALERVHSLLSARQKSRLQLLKYVARLRLTVRRAGAALARFRELKRHLDTKIGQVRKVDAERIVAVHATDYTVVVEGAIRSALDVATKAESFGESLTKYPRQMLSQLREYNRLCESAALRLDTAFLELRNDMALLARNCGIRYRIREAVAAIAAGWRSRARAAGSDG